jgi:hypothetical protein
MVPVQLKTLLSKEPAASHLGSFDHKLPMHGRALFTQHPWPIQVALSTILGCTELMHQEMLNVPGVGLLALRAGRSLSTARAVLSIQQVLSIGFLNDHSLTE